MVVLAGSEILTTNTFQASVSGFQKHLKTDYNNSLNLIREGVYLARKAIENSVIEGQYSIMYCMIILCQVFVWQWQNIFMPKKLKVWTLVGYKTQWMFYNNRTENNLL